MGRRRFHPAVWRLALVAILFACWMGYLGYLVSKRDLTPDGAPMVVSRPQILVSDVAVVAHLDKVEGPAKVEEVLWEKDPTRPVRVGDSLKVTNLAECRAFGRQKRDASDSPPTPAPDFAGPGRYLLLLRHGADGFEVARVPNSPGYPPPNDAHEHEGRPRIYAIHAGSTDVVDQFKAAAKPIAE